jgi:hypothetical protein
MKTSVLFNKLVSYPLSLNMGEILKLPSKWITGFSAGEISFNLTLENKSSYKLGVRPRVSITSFDRIKIPPSFFHKPLGNSI